MLWDIKKKKETFLISNEHLQSKNFMIAKSNRGS